MWALPADIVSTIPLSIESAAIVETDHYHPATEAEGAATFGAIGIGLLTTVFVVIFLLDALTAQRFMEQCRGQSIVQSLAKSLMCSMILD